MILGFKQQFPWKEPTNFREKILYGVGRAIWLTPRQIKKFAKIHTMREDPHNRWKPGMSIQMVYRGPKYSILDHFNKGIPELEKCVSVQQIKIQWITFTVAEKSFQAIDITIDGGKSLRSDQIMILAANDGFNSVEDFMRWFNKDWEGKIIHWTDFRY